MPTTCGLQAIGIAMKKLSRPGTVHSIGCMVARRCLSLYRARNACFHLGRSICEPGQFNSELYRFLSCHGKVASILWGPILYNSVSSTSRFRRNACNCMSEGADGLSCISILLYDGCGKSDNLCGLVGR